MNPDIERLAKEAGLGWVKKINGVTAVYGATPEQLAKFAAFMADDIAQMVLDMSCGKPLEWAENVADAIRAKFPAPKGDA